VGAQQAVPLPAGLSRGRAFRAASAGRCRRRQDPAALIGAGGEAHAAAARSRRLLHARVQPAGGVVLPVPRVGVRVRRRPPRQPPPAPPPQVNERTSERPRSARFSLRILRVVFPPPDYPRRLLFFLSVSGFAPAETLRLTSSCSCCRLAVVDAFFGGGFVPSRCCCGGVIYPLWFSRPCASAGPGLSFGFGELYRHIFLSARTRKEGESDGREIPFPSFPSTHHLFSLFFLKILN
jgi:hypothetical protein